MRALYTAASGLHAQQTQLDLIANNISNLNTTGYKTKNAQFAELLRSTREQPDSVQVDGRRSDLGLQLGNGVRGAFLAQNFSQGNLQTTGNMLDLAVEGNGFLTVGVPNPDQPGTYETLYTRAGKFQLDPTTGMIVNDNGFPLINEGEPLVVPEEYRGQPLSISGNGDVVVQADNGPETIGYINLVLVENPEANLQEASDNLYRNIDPNRNNNADIFKPWVYLTPAEQARAGAIRQGVLEMSNVDLPQEMSELVQVQRAYQLNSRSIQTVDTMMGLANNLRA